MLITVPTCLVFAEILIVSQCAPKLGPISFESLSFEGREADNEIIPPLVPIPARIVLRTENNSEGQTKRPCLGYDFDELNCKIVNNRLLCGYNKNIGKLKNDAEIVDMGNGCHIRGDRLECGYLQRPFIGIRRPPPLDTSGNLMRQSQTKTPSEELIFKKLRATVSSIIRSSKLNDEIANKLRSTTTRSNNIFSLKSSNALHVPSTLDNTTFVSLRNEKSTTTYTKTSESKDNNEDGTDAEIETGLNTQVTKKTESFLSTTKAKSLNSKLQGTAIRQSKSKIPLEKLKGMFLRIFRSGKVNEKTSNRSESSTMRSSGNLFSKSSNALHDPNVITLDNFGPVFLRNEESKTTSMEISENEAATEITDATDTSPVKENYEGSNTKVTNRTEGFDSVTMQTLSPTSKQHETELNPTKLETMEKKIRKRALTRRYFVTACVEKGDRIVCYDKIPFAREK